MKRKVVSTMLCVAMVASMLVGCAQTKEAEVTTTDETADETTEVSADEVETEVVAEDITGEITVITHRTDLIDTKFADYKAAFEAKYPGTTVNFESITDYETDMGIRMQTTEYGDVLSLPNSIQNADFANYFEPMGTVDELKTKYKEDFLYAKQYEGTVYGLASTINCQGMVYNKKVFADAGITEMPKTSEEFLAALQKIKDNTDAIPYYTNFAAGWPLTQWQDQCWGSVTGDPEYHNNVIPREENPFSEGKSNYVVHKLLFDIVKNGLCEEDPVTTDWEKCKAMINNGEIGVMTLGSWSIVQMQAAGENPDNIGYMPFPSNVDGKQFSTAGADYCYAVNKNSDNKATARAWVNFMIDESGFASSEGGISLLIDSELPDTLKDFTAVELVVDAPATAENDGLFDLLSNESEIVLYGDTEKVRIVEAALGTSGETFEEIMADWNERWTAAQQENIE